MLRIIHNIPKIVLLLMAVFLLACGRTIINETPPSFNRPLITSVNVLPNNRVKIDWFFDAYQEPLINGFRIERSENNGVFKILSDDMPPTQRTLEVAEPFRNGKVSFRLLSKTTKDTVASAVVSYFAPAVVNSAFCSSLSAILVQAIEKPNVYLSWKLEPNSSTYAGSYLVQRSAKQGPFQTIATVRNSFFLDETTETGVNYSYIVRLATNNCASNEIPIRVVSDGIGLCPQDFKGTLVIGKDKKSVLFNWNAQLANFNSFYVLRSSGISGVFENLTPAGIQATVYEDKSALKEKTTYVYKIITKIDTQPPNSCETMVVEIKNQ